jgi:AmmeMemoRadiSam system protein A
VLRKEKKDVKQLSALDERDKHLLLKLARSSIESELIEGEKIKRPAEPKPAMLEKRGCFVTLHKGGGLRGCIGTIEPTTSLLTSVEENSKNAAFKDPRFPSLTKDEISDIDIEISVLTIPKKLSFVDGEDLKHKLKPGIHGVILSQGWHRSTFLPQVWEQLPDKEEFLECLCQKGCMEKTSWKSSDTTVQIYEVEYFSE